MTKHLKKHPGYTIVLPVTNTNPVPSGAAVTPNPDGSATAIASRHVDKRRLHMALFRCFGNLACWPFAEGRRWLVKINPPAPAEVEREEAA